MKLTDAQKRAIAHTKGNLQIIACAGSGKTEVVARYIANLLNPSRNLKITPANIVAFTFTNKAAAELKDRINAKCRALNPEMPGLAELFVGTIHSFCQDLLKTEVPRFLKYDVLNEVQQALFIDRHSKQSGLTRTTLLDGRPLRRYRDTNIYIQALSILREAELNKKELRDNSAANGLALYKELLDGRDYFDWSSILEEAVIALKNETGLRKRIGQRIRYLIVDEYQDVNPVQESLIRILHELGAKLCVVGDDDQTVHQWRGSDVQNIITFKQRYNDVKQERIEENFRSSEGIIETSKAFIAKNSERLAKAMQPANTQQFEIGDVVALAFDDPDSEARYISSAIKSLIGIAFEEDGIERGLSWSDVAILLRSVKQSGAPITKALSDNGIPFVIGGMNNLFSRIEAEAARKIFYFIGGIIDEDELSTSWKKANLGLSKKNIEKAIAGAKASKDALANPTDKRWGFYSLQRQFLTFLEDLELREELVPDDQSAGQLLSGKQGEIVFYNLGKFSQLISDFESIHYHSDPVNKYNAFCGFLQYRAQGAYPEGWQDSQYVNLDAVRVMTIHQAKGLQWPAVFIPALVQNRFPCKKPGGRNIWHLLPKKSVVNQPRYEGSIEDERRLFYVAMTRAQKFLHLTWAPIPDNSQAQYVSEFWEDILESKWVKRKAVSYTPRKRLPARPKENVSNVSLSFSEVKYFFECPYQFKLRVLYGFNAPIHEALGYGKSLHDALAEVHKAALEGKTFDPSDATKLVATHLHTPYAYETLRNMLEDSAKKIIQNYLRDNRALFKNIEFSEKGVEINLGDGVSVTGRIDLVRRIDTGEITIVDLKSNDRAQPEQVTENQLHMYALGYKELTGRNADYVEIYELDSGEKKPRSVDDDFIEDVKRGVNEAAYALRNSTFKKAPSDKKCEKCDYKMMCSKIAKA